MNTNKKREKAKKAEVKKTLATFGKGESSYHEELEENEGNKQNTAKAEFVDYLHNTFFDKGL